MEGVFNWTIIHIRNRIGLRSFNGDKCKWLFLSKFDLNNNLRGHAKKVGVHSQVFQETIAQACGAWERYFKKISGRPKLKGRGNKMRSFTFPQILERNSPSKTTGKINLPGFGLLKFHRQSLPEGKIKQIKVLKKSSGWYASLTIDAMQQIIGIKETDSKVGVDTGFKNLAVLSDGTKYENDRIYVKGQKQLGKIQRGKNKRKSARYHERMANRRKDRNHKISLDIVRNHKEIYITNDNLKNQSRKFGKSVGDAGIAQIRNFIIYKGSICGRKVSLVCSKNTTRRCNICWALTGPKGLNQLGVRLWECTVCGTKHDRDVNSGRVILKTGLGLSLVPSTGIKLETSNITQEFPSDARVSQLTSI